MLQSDLFSLVFWARKLKVACLLAAATTFIRYQLVHKHFTLVRELFNLNCQDFVDVVKADNVTKGFKKHLHKKVSDGQPGYSIKILSVPSSFRIW